MNTEIWHKCEVPYTRYEVSNLGRVRMRTRNRCSGQGKGEMAICKLGFGIKVSEEYIASIPLWPPPLWKVGEKGWR